MDDAPADSALSLQERYAPRSVCFGCGPANEKGLRIRSFESGDHIVAEFRPEQHHEAFPGVLCGGIIGTLLDCHGNWAAAHAFMRQAGDDQLPGTVTAEYHVRMRRPTPTDGVLRLRARVVELTERRGLALDDLRTHRPTLEDVFVSLTGKHLRDE